MDATERGDRRRFPLDPDATEQRRDVIVGDRERTSR
jgi:hypothetical protein